MGTVNVGPKRRRDNPVGRAHRKNVVPDGEVSLTDPAVLNLASLVDVQFKPLFSELYQRGRGDVAAFASDFLDTELHEGQKRWVHSFPWATERHLSCANRWGKSLVTSIKMLHSCFYQVRPPQYSELTKDYIAINLSLTLDMAQIAFDYALQRALDNKIFSRFVVRDEIRTAPFPALVVGSPKFRGGVGEFRSEFWARSTSKDARYLLGKHFDFINYDEAARDPRGDKILDEVLRMRLADRAGRIDMTSTAAGKNWFFIAYNRGLNDKLHISYYSQTGTAYENPHISHERVKENEKIMARQWVEQNIYGGFADYANVFNRGDVEACYLGMDYHVCDDYTQLGTVRVHPDHRYIMAIDWALRKDETVMLVADVTESPALIVFAQGFSFKQTGVRWSWDEIKTAAVLVHKRFNDAVCVYDSTGMAGEVIGQELGTLGMYGHVGYDFAGGSGKQKDHLILVAQQALQNRIIHWPFVPALAPLYDQLTLYDRNDKYLDTDWVFAFCLLCENYRRANLPHSEILDAPFIWERHSFRIGAGNPMERIEAREGVDRWGDKWVSPDPEYISVLTNTGWIQVPVNRPGGEPVLVPMPVPIPVPAEPEEVGPIFVRS